MEDIMKTFEAGFSPQEIEVSRFVRHRYEEIKNYVNTYVIYPNAEKNRLELIDYALRSVNRAYRGLKFISADCLSDFFRDIKSNGLKPELSSRIFKFDPSQAMTVDMYSALGFAWPRDDKKIGVLLKLNTRKLDWYHMDFERCMSLGCWPFCAIDLEIRATKVSEESLAGLVILDGRNYVTSKDTMPKIYHYNKVPEITELSIEGQIC